MNYTEKIKEHIAVMGIIPTKDVLLACKMVGDTLKNGGKIFIAGNGGSACDAQHFASELTGRFVTERKGLPAIALTHDITAIANDYGYDKIFSRQLNALACEKDLFIGISTSGKSENIIQAIKSSPCPAIALTGRCGMIADLCVNIMYDNTARIQEAHIFIIHLICEYVDSIY